jgi:hypothetical protein
MVLLSPGRLFVVQECEQPAAAKLGACRLHQKSAPPTAPDELIDFFDQIFRQNDMCPLRSHS